MNVENRQALLFPGQGISSREIIEFHSRLQEVNEKSTRQALGIAQDAINEVFGHRAFPVQETLRDSTSPNFQQTAFIHPVTYTLSIVGHELARDKVHPHLVAGHSLGEYPAITVAHVITKEAGIQIVTYRGKFMQEACEESETKLVSIAGLRLEEVRSIYDHQDEIARVALVNAEDLIVVGCNANVVRKVEEMARENGAKRTMILDTQGAYHTDTMDSAAIKMGNVLSSFKFNNPGILFASNLTGKLTYDGEQIRQYLVSSMTRAVQWAKTVDTLRQKGTVDFVEVGPGNSLAILNRKNGVDREKTRNILELIS